MIEGNGKDSQPVVQEPQAQKHEESVAPAPPGEVPLFAIRGKLPSRQALAQNKVLVVAGGAVAVVLLLFVFASAPSTKRVGRGAKPGVRQAQQGTETEGQQPSLFPVIESSRPPAKTADGGLVGEQDVAHTATLRPPQNNTFSPSALPQNGTLGSIPPFDQGTWQAPPYHPTSGMVPASNEAKVERDHPSLVFVQKPIQVASVSSPEPMMLGAPSIGLPIGTRLRARLESAASTAVKAPVIAVIEYNYEKDGQIILPAGTKAFGRIEQADRTGYMSIRFDLLLMPDGSRNDIDAVATNLKLGPLRGKVEGKNTGKNILVRSLSGIGEVGALLAGRSGSINQPFSEGDLLRERISNNIGESADQTLLGLSVSEHVVVSIFADTPVYLVLDRSAKQAPVTQSEPRPVPSSPANSAESLRQLLQLQRELNQSVDVASH